MGRSPPSRVPGSQRQPFLAAAGFATHLPNTFDLLAFVPYVVVKAASPMLLRSAWHGFAAFRAACLSAGEAAAAAPGGYKTGTAARARAGTRVHCVS